MWIIVSHAPLQWKHGALITDQQGIPYLCFLYIFISQGISTTQNLYHILNGISII